MTSERCDWVDGIANRLIHRAAQRAPNSLSKRLEEEWLADFAEQRGSMTRLRFAIGCCWATNVIAREYVAAAIPVATIPTGHAHFVPCPEDSIPTYAGRAVTILVVIFLHAAVFCGLAMGLVPEFTKIMADPFTVRVFDPPPRQSLPVPPRSEVRPTQIRLPTQEIAPRLQWESTEAIEGIEREPPGPALPPSLSSSPPTAVNRVPGGPAAGFPSTNDFYPDAAIRAREEGVATVRACVDGRGRLTSEPTIVESTGSARLDQGAVKLAKAGSGHYRPTTEDGQAVDACYPFRIRFELRN